MIQSFTTNSSREERDPTLVRIIISISGDCFSRFPTYTKVIKSMYKLSKATCLRIRNDDRLHIYQDKRIVQDQTSSIIPAVAKEFIIKYLLPPQKPIRIKDLRELVFKNFGKDLSYHTLQKFIQAELRYSFK